MLRDVEMGAVIALTEQGAPLERAVAEVQIVSKLDEIHSEAIWRSVSKAFAADSYEDLDVNAQDKVAYRRAYAKACLIASLVAAAKNGVSVSEARTALDAALAEVFDEGGAFRTLETAYGVQDDPTPF